MEKLKYKSGISPSFSSIADDPEAYTVRMNNRKIKLAEIDKLVKTVESDLTISDLEESYEFERNN